MDRKRCLLLKIIFPKADAHLEICLWLKQINEGDQKQIRKQEDENN